MRQKPRLIMIRCLFFLLLFWIFPVTSNAFYGFINLPGSHIELTETAFTPVYQCLSGEVSAVGTVPLYDIHYYLWKPNLPVNFLANASRETDIYLFGPAYPHGQTASYPIRRTYTTGELQDIEARALLAYVKFMAETLDKVRQSYESGDSRSALFRLGLFLHSYQDLFAHQGITNEQHLWLEKKGQNPDTNLKSIQQCRESLTLLAQNLPSLLGSIAGPEFQWQLMSTTEIKPITAKERRRILGHGPDIYWEGIKYKLISYPPVCARYLDRIRWDYLTLAGLLNSRKTLETAGKIREIKAFKKFLKGYGYKF